MLQKVTQEKKLSYQLQSDLLSSLFSLCLVYSFHMRVSTNYKKKLKCMSSAEYIYTWGDDLTTLIKNNNNKTGVETEHHPGLWINT